MINRHFPPITAQTPVVARSAYTLIEMLIASVLVATLMSVVWSMMSMYNGYLTAGQSQAVEQQLVRSVLLLLEDDLQRVALPDTNTPITPSFETIGELNGESSDSATPESLPPVDPFSIDADELSLFSVVMNSGAAAPGRISMIGNSHSVRLSVELNVPESFPVSYGSAPVTGNSVADSGIETLASAITADTQTSADDVPAIEGMAPNVDEFRTIIWQFEPTGVISSGPSSLRSGLYRIETDSLALQTALSQQETLAEEAPGSSDSSVDRMTLEALLFPPTNVSGVSGNPEFDNGSGTESGIPVPLFDLVPEIVGCRFEYFSGSMWMNSWNSEQQQGLPLAVRVRLHFVSSENLEKLSLAFGDPVTTETPFDDALNATVAGSASAAFSPLQENQPPESLTSIPTHKFERIILLQPVSGPMPDSDAQGKFNELSGSDRSLMPGGAL